MVQIEMEDCSELKNHLLHSQCTPVVLSGYINTWPASKWSVANIDSVLDDQLIEFRIGKKHEEEVQWETKCEFRSASATDLKEWLQKSASSSNPLKEFDPDIYWCYAGYKYMQEIFANSPSILQSVDWSVLGFDGRDGKQSTFWLGSSGASTVCHYDTYGCNLVAQISGRKRWVLFPPSDTPDMYPTRIPYEESSVFSQVNVLAPNLKKHPLFQNCHPHVVTLEPGDVLFVPRHWWHYVECLDDSISINTWVEMEEDCEERLSEAISRTLSFALMSEGSVEFSSWLNPTEEYIPSFDENCSYIGNSLKEIQSNQMMKQQEKNKPVSPSNGASYHLEQIQEDTHKKIKLDTSQTTQLNRQVQDVVATSWEDFCAVFNVNTENSCDGKVKGVDSFTSLDLLECLTQPDVVSLICEKLKKKF